MDYSQLGCKGADTGHCLNRIRIPRRGRKKAGSRFLRITFRGKKSYHEAAATRSYERTKIMFDRELKG